MYLHAPDGGSMKHDRSASQYRYTVAHVNVKCVYFKYALATLSCPTLPYPYCIDRGTQISVSELGPPGPARTVVARALRGMPIINHHP